MKKRTSGGLLAVVVASFIAPACGSSLPHENGVVWECAGTAVDQDLQGNQQVIAIIGTGAVEIHECADRGTDLNEVNSACKDDCESKFRAWGFFPEAPFLYHDITGCTITGALPTARRCHDPVEPFNGGPADARLALDQSNSTVSVNVKGHTGHGNASGTLDLMIDPFCTTSPCALYIARFDLGVTPFDLDGHSVHDVNVQNAGSVAGRWQSDTAFVLAPNSVAVSLVFNIDDDSGSTTLANTTNSLHGNLSRDYSTFTLAGDFDNGDGSTVHLELSGHAIAHPPVAQFAPQGRIQCDAPPGIAHVTLDSTASSDPDGDIAHRGWKVDGQLAALDQTKLPQVLSVGSHQVALDIVDSRAAVSESRGEITVVDDTPPTVDASLTPTCLWPPNHKYVLYSFSNGIAANAVDTCDAHPTIHIVNVTSDQPALGGGSGNTAPDVKFGTGGFCVRAERDGTLKTDRTYTVTLEIGDAANNRTRKEMTIRIPHDMAGGERKDCPNVDPSRLVDDGDPRCTEVATDAPAADGPSGAANQDPAQLAAKAAANDTAHDPATPSCAMSRAGIRSQGQFAVVMIPALLLMLRRRRTLVRKKTSIFALFAVFMTACGRDDGGSAAIPNSPLAASVSGTAVHISGGHGEWSADHSRLTLLLTSYTSQCGTIAPSPSNGETLTEIVVSIPRDKARPGDYPISVDLSRDATGVGIGITQYDLAGNGKIEQHTTYAQSGTLRIDRLEGANVTGGVSMTQTAAAISGVFTAPMCN